MVLKEKTPCPLSRSSARWLSPSALTVPQVMVMSLFLEHGQLPSLVTADVRGWLAFAYTIFIGGIVGFGLWFWLIARCSMNRVAPFGLLLPVFALISSVLFLGDRMTPKLIAGGLIAISGVAIAQIKPCARPT
jgi:O-acetylserine/cysteine efflux transporter